MSAILTFLAGSTFRMIWGEASKWLSAQQEHKHEQAMIQLQAQVDAQRFEQQQSAIKLQAELGIKTIHAQSEADLEKIDATGFYEAATAAINSKTGVAIIDAWNGAIRPLCASIAVFLWVLALNHNGFAMGDWDKELVAGILGFYFASREFKKRS